VDADVSAWLIRLGWEWWRFLFKLETGYASGDSKPTNDRFTVRAANQNTIVGLVLYPIALAEITRTRWADEDGLWSKGGIYNSHYFMQTIRFEPIDGLEILVAFIEAWRDKVDGAVIPRHNAGDSKFLGFETDVAVKYHFYRDHAHVGLEFGVLRIGKALEDPMLNMPTNTWTLQLWSAFTF